MPYFQFAVSFPDCPLHSVSKKLPKITAGRIDMFYFFFQKGSHSQKFISQFISSFCSSGYASRTTAQDYDGFVFPLPAYKKASFS